ncbi:MAG: DUF1553 domain-containing protein [Verrucomicrobiaceae bacterium]|nr:DUF1553 domain-containing protein [Verrucomicrobiaceae bacterium]
MNARLLSLFCFSALVPPQQAAEPKQPNPLYEAGPMVMRTDADATASDKIDELVMKRLQAIDLKPANLCSDAVFLRRAYLVVIGTLPTEEEAREFLASKESDRREQLIEDLMERDEFYDFWTMKWCDILRVKAEFPIKLWPNAAQAYHRWIYSSVRGNKPLHQLARQLLVANGSNFREGEVNFYRAMQDRTPKGIAATVALTFMGERAEKWPEKKLEAMSGFFSQIAFKTTAEWKEEIVFFNPDADKDGLSKKTIFPDGTPVRIEMGKEDPRMRFADWLLRPENPWFSRSMANRIWSWLMGRGIVEEPDDMRADNPPSNPELLAFLEKEFATSRCDMKHLFRIILNSQTFQLSSLPAQKWPEAAVNFAHYPLRRMEAEVLIDALNQLTDTEESYSSPIPEPFTFIPEDVRAIALADGSITSSFLELFGRPPRDTGYESERSRSTSAAQRLHLLNSSHVHEKVAACPLVTGAGNAQPAQLAEKIYHAVLSRPPTRAELFAIESHASETYARPQELAEDLVWALINEPEFVYIH